MKYLSMLAILSTVVFPGCDSKVQVVRYSDIEEYSARVVDPVCDCSLLVDNEELKRKENKFTDTSIVATEGVISGESTIAGQSFLATTEATAALLAQQRANIDMENLPRFSLRDYAESLDISEDTFSNLFTLSNNVYTLNTDVGTDELLAEREISLGFLTNEVVFPGAAALACVYDYDSSNSNEDTKFGCCSTPSTNRLFKGVAAEKVMIDTEVYGKYPVELNDGGNASRCAFLRKNNKKYHAPPNDDPKESRRDIGDSPAYCGGDAYWKVDYSKKPNFGYHRLPVVTMEDIKKIDVRFLKVNEFSVQDEKKKIKINRRKKKKAQAEVPPDKK